MKPVLQSTTNSRGAERFIRRAVENPAGKGNRIAAAARYDGLQTCKENGMNGKLVAGLFVLLTLALPVRAEVPRPGSVAPEFSLPDQKGVVRSLVEWRGRWVVLYFYPKDDTPGCTAEACAFYSSMTAVV
jgi:hypothetical protein